MDFRIWLIIENIVLIFMIAFAIYYTESLLPLFGLLFCNNVTINDGEKNENRMD